MFGGQDIASLDEAELAKFRNRQIGFVWQNPSLLPEFTALENVMMPLLIRGIARVEATEAAFSRLEEVGLKNRALHRAGELSGGEQQRVVLARALVAKPEVLFADEPIGSLDFKTGQAIMALLRSLHSSHNLTSVFVTHNRPLAAQCDRILELTNSNLELRSAMQLQDSDDKRRNPS